MEPIEIIIYPLIGFAAATAGSLMGVGGGFMMVPIFMFLGFNRMYNVNLAPILSLFVIIFVALSASVKYSYEKSINYRLGLMYAPFSIIGTLVGTQILNLIKEFSFKIIFTIIIGIVGIRLIYNRKKKSNTESQDIAFKGQCSYYWVFFWGFLTGLTASIVGIGGGLIAVPVIHIFFLETMHIAIATSLFIMIFTASFSTVSNCFIYIEVLDTYFFIAGLLVAAGAIIGSQIGSLIQIRLKGKTLQLLFGYFMMGIAIPLLWLGS
ncbi:MAG: sulfite exporter TauE/SafE family protein [Promethearchaeota archaeon]